MLEYLGKEYAQVSDIIKPFVDFSHIPDEILEKKARIGSRIHHAIKQEIEGNLSIVSVEEAGYFQSFEKWKKMLTPNFREMEVRHYCNQRMLTGCIDAIVQLKNEEKAVIIDWKTSASESPVSWPMQGHLYHYLATQSGLDIAPRFLFVKLDKNGNLPHVFQYKFDKNLMNRCFDLVDEFWEKKLKSS